MTMASDAPEEAPKESDPLIAKSNASNSFGGWDFGLWDWFQQLKGQAGFELLAVLFVSQHLHRGIVDHMTSNAASYVYRSYHVKATQMQIYEGVSKLPWAMKPAIGLVSDVFPIMGYNKVPYMLAVSVLGFVGFLFVGVLPKSTLPVQSVALCIFMQNMQLSTNDLLTEAKYAEKIREVPSAGPSILSYVWSGMNVGGLIGVLLAGILVAKNPRAPYTLSAILSFAIFIPLSLGYMKERKIRDEELAAHRRRFREESEACFLSIMMFIVVVTIAVLGILTEDPIANGILALTALFVMMVCVSLVLSPVMAKFAVFSMLQSSLTLSTSGAGFYFMTDSPTQYPEGPHFSEFFYTSVIGMVGMVMSLIGVFTYQRFMSRWRYRPLFVVANVAYAAVSLLDCIMYLRLNKRLGIPDHLFLVSSNVLGQLIFQWQWMPQVVVLSYLCPPGMEATMYALLAGTHNLGVSVSSTIGSFLLRLLHCQPSGALHETEQFRNLWIASLVSVVLPLITILVLIDLVPDGRQGETLSEERSATAGSIWRRLRGVDGPRSASSSAAV